ncbi:hypothetical protein, partial [Bacillus paramycoides]|uniref:hypothetical protein n=1 Tax=Bacillus paramycoides TaxID=2026194 RepID=UPI003D063C48
PTFITSINDNKILREKTAFYIKIYLKLMDVGYHPIAIKLAKLNFLEMKKNAILSVYFYKKNNVFSVL